MSIRMGCRLSRSSEEKYSKKGRRPTRRLADQGSHAPQALIFFQTHFQFLPSP